MNLGWGREPPLLPVGQHTAPGKHHRRFFCDGISLFVVVEDAEKDFEEHYDVKNANGLLKNISFFVKHPF